MRLARFCQALVLILLAMAGTGLAGRALAQVPDDIAIGAIRWDAWFEGVKDAKIFEHPDWRGRAPFFAEYDQNGKVHLEGDQPKVLQAEVAYARAMGLDYFIFSYYPDTGSWGRDPVFHRRLNGALSAYLKLPDRMGVKFAISFNQLFPLDEAGVMARNLANFAAHPDYMVTHSGTLPVFILGHDTLEFTKVYGTEERARSVFAAMRKAVRERTGKEITFVLMHYSSDKAWDSVRTYGLDMVTTYSNFAPGKGAVAQDSAACQIHSQNVWVRAARAGVPYAPNITLGWDNRPRRQTNHDGKGSPQGPWCLPPTMGGLADQFREAARFVVLQDARPPFRTITIYAWNEFTEGGWMTPTLGNPHAWMEELRAAIGRGTQRRVDAPIDMPIEWPCPAGTARALSEPHCNSVARPTTP